jgi:hypothetical protein
MGIHTVPTYDALCKNANGAHKAQGFMIVKIHIVASWAVTRHSLVGGDRSYGGTYCLHFLGLPPLG